MESVHSRLNSTTPLEIELIQTLLLLGSNWLGEPDGLLRSQTFELAFRLVLTLNLQSDAFNQGTMDDYLRSRRRTIFWTAYVADKLVAVAAGRTGLISNGDHDIPGLIIDDIRGIGSMGGLICSEDDLSLIHLLVVAFISLTQILDQAQQLLYPLQAKRFQSLGQVHAVIRPIETSLEKWCREHKDLLSETSGQGGIKRSLCAALITLLYLTQLQIYQPALRWEHFHSGQQVIAFGIVNSTALTGSIEAAWHLTHLGVVEHENQRPQLSFESFAVSIDAFSFGERRSL